MKAACIIYHKNAYQIYKPEWIDMCTTSIRKQTYSAFDIFELNYDDKEESVFREKPANHFFFKRPCINFIDGMNYLLDKVFNELNYDCCFNVNLDDYYALDRFEKQIQYMKIGVDVVSSNIVYVDEQSNIIRHIQLHRHNLKKALLGNHNVVAHPVVCYSKKFWQGCGGYDVNQIKHEDLLMWRKTINRFRFYVINDYLLFHRIHSNKVSTSDNT
jgi:hypothetical protein